MDELVGEHVVGRLMTLNIDFVLNAWRLCCHFVPSHSTVAAKAKLYNRQTASAPIDINKENIQADYRRIGKLIWIRQNMVVMS